MYLAGDKTVKQIEAITHVGKSSLYRELAARGLK
ncbi:hypothetical protein [Brevibacillus migulae]